VLFVCDLKISISLQKFQQSQRLREMDIFLYLDGINGLLDAGEQGSQRRVACRLPKVLHHKPSEGPGTEGAWLDSSFTR
jgi:hypothetical protein